MSENLSVYLVITVLKLIRSTLNFYPCQIRNKLGDKQNRSSKRLTGGGKYVPEWGRWCIQIGRKSRGISHTVVTKLKI